MSDAHSAGSDSLAIRSCVDHEDMVAPRTDGPHDVMYERCPECGKWWGWNRWVGRTSDDPITFEYREPEPPSELEALEIIAEANANTMRLWEAEAARLRVYEQAYIDLRDWLMHTIPSASTIGVAQRAVEVCVEGAMGERPAEEGA